MIPLNDPAFAIEIPEFSSIVMRTCVTSLSIFQHLFRSIESYHLKYPKILGSFHLLIMITQNTFHC